MTNRLEIRKIAELRPYENNARVHSPEQIDRLRASLRAYGFVRPLLINAEGMVLAGHGILEAAKAEGLTEAPCVPVEHLSAEEARGYILADNRLAELSAWDEEIVSGELSAWDEEIVSGELTALRDAGFGLDLTGFDGADLHLGDDPAGAPEITEDDFDPEPPEEPMARRGQIWQLGEHRLMCGDATSADDVHLCVGGGQPADMVFTDPPYGISIVKGSIVGGGGPTHFGRIGGKNIVPATKYIPLQGDENTDVFRAAWAICQDSSKTQIVFGGHYFSDFLPISRCWLIWDKNNTGAFGDAELAWTSFDKPVRLYRYTWNGLVREGRRDVEGVHRVHPTQKPVGLFAEILRDWTLEGMTVLDPFGGSGTTLIACEQTGRRCCMMEIDPHYCDVIIRRWEEFTGKKAVLIHG